MPSTSNARKRPPAEIIIGKAVLKEMKELPDGVRDRFLVDLVMISKGMEPCLQIQHLKAAGDGVMELKINGSPAYRLVYTAKFLGKIVVLAARAKTAQGTDKTLIDVARKRFQDHK